MLNLDKDAVFCDFVQYYGRSPEAFCLSEAAILAYGLPDDSRIKRRLIGSKVSQEVLLLAMVVDRLSMLIYMQTKDAKHHRNKPKQLTELLTQSDEHDEKEKTFVTAEDFEAARNKALDALKGGK